MSVDLPSKWRLSISARDSLCLARSGSNSVEDTLEHEAVDRQQLGFVLCLSRFGQEREACSGHDEAEYGSHGGLARDGLLVYNTVFNVPAGLASPFSFKPDVFGVPQAHGRDIHSHPRPHQQAGVRHQRREVQRRLPGRDAYVCRSRLRT